MNGDQVQTLLKNVINAALAPAGLQVLRRRDPAVLMRDPQYVSVVGEVEGALRALLFPHMPERKNRVELMAQHSGTHPSESMYLLGALHEAIALDGDVCEFGVAEGATSALLANEIAESTKRLWLFDSFEGLSKPTAKDRLIDDIFNLGSMEAYAGKISIPESQVRERLGHVGFPPERTMVVRGFIEESSKREPSPRQVCFAYVDFDFYEPILTALDFLHPRMPVGATVVVDDYGFFSEGAQVATDEFVAKQAGRYTMTLPLCFAGHFAVLRKVEL